MGAVYFYHLTRTPLEDTLPVLLGKARAAGWRTVVRVRDAGRLDWLDTRLWQGDGFLPHGRSGGEFDAEQPILLSDNPSDLNAANCLVSVDGAEVTAAEVAPLERAMILFDGNDPTALDYARGQWKTLCDAGCSAQYWSQDSGRWEMKAQSA